MWQWSTAESDYVDAWTETFAEPSQITGILAPTMVSSADATVALTDPASDAVTVSGPSMGVAAGLYWLAYLQTAGQPANCDDGATASSVPFSATGTSGGTFRAAAVGGNLVFSSAQRPVEVFGPGTYTPPSPPTFSETGTYEWVAVLEDLNTGNVIAQGTCGDPTEQTDVVLFDLTSTALSIAASGTSVSDTATVTGPTPTGATIKFAAYKQTAAGDECDTNVVYTGDPMPLTGPGAYKSASTVLSTGRYDWVATTYDRDGNVLKQGTCGDPTEVSTVMPVLATTGVVIAAAGLWGGLGMVALGRLFVGGWLLLTRRVMYQGRIQMVVATS